MWNWLKDKWAGLVADLKKIHKSWTVWFNGLMAAAIFLLPEAESQLPAIKDYVPENVCHYAAGALVVVNIILRFKTVSALRGK